jgi:hypothetical protein
MQVFPRSSFDFFNRVDRFSDSASSFIHREADLPSDLSSSSAGRMAGIVLCFELFHTSRLSSVSGLLIQDKKSERPTEKGI